MAIYSILHLSLTRAPRQTIFHIDELLYGNVISWVLHLFANVPLPVFDRNQGEIARTRYALTQAEEQERSAGAHEPGHHADGARNSRVRPRLLNSTTAA